MPRDWKFRLEDALNAIDKIQSYTSGMSLSEFEVDEKTIDAVLKNFEVIGEASRHIPTDVKERHPDVPWIEIMAMRNFIVHEYFGVSTKIIWETIMSDLPNLRQQMKKIL